MSLERNARVAARWDELTARGKHGHYETLFQVVREEVTRAHPVLRFFKGVWCQFFHWGGVSVRQDGPHDQIWRCKQCNHTWIEN